jgi:hypothetical protein
LKFKFCQFTNVPVVNTAPKTSRAIISKKRFSQLQGRDDFNSSTQLANQSTLPTFPQTNAETRNSGKIKLLVNDLDNNKMVSDS